LEPNKALYFSAGAHAITDPLERHSAAIQILPEMKTCQSLVKSLTERVSK